MVDNINQPVSIWILKQTKPNSEGKKMTYTNVKVIKTVEISGEEFQITSGDYEISDGMIVKGFVDGHFSGDNDVRLPRKFFGMSNYKIAQEIYGSHIA